MRGLLLAVAAAAGLLLGGLGPATAAREGEATVTEVHVVRTEDPEAEFAFAPAEVTIPAGGTVRWVNDGEVYHTVTTADTLGRLVANNVLRGRLFRAGDTVEFVFTEPGEYAYFCQPHTEFMAGIVRVVDAGETASREGSQ